MGIKNKIKKEERNEPKWIFTDEQSTNGINLWAKITLQQFGGIATAFAIHRGKKRKFEWNKSSCPLGN
jgi:hypothetical protein